MHDVASNALSKLSEFILNGDWNFPNHSYANLIGIIQELPPISTSDCVVSNYVVDPSFSFAKAKDACYS